jgi:group II intron reverse transcriptase/maturase
MIETPSSQSISTKLERIAKQAKDLQGASLTTLAHYIDEVWMHEAYRRTRKDGARGIDGQTAAQYAEDLGTNLRSLLDRMKSGRYWAPPVRRVHIPKGDGSETRPIGIPTFEDKVAQRAVAMVIGQVYEQEFYDFSYGFRPGRTAHQALKRIRTEAMGMGGGWVVEVDIRKFFDSVDHAVLREVLCRRIGDGVLLRLIGKWLNAGVLEDQVLSRPEEGTPQGGVISPLLANVLLHEVFDAWFVKDVVPVLAGRSVPVRYADDIAVLFANERDARRFLAVLPKRFGKYGLTLHPDKTQLVRFQRPTPVDNDDNGPGTFNLLGFTLYWGKSRKGWWVVKQKTAKDRFRRALHRIKEWCQWHRHDSLEAQHAMLAKKVRGHYAHYGVSFNFGAIDRFLRGTKRSWWRALRHRSQRPFPWQEMERLLKRFPLPQPHIVHRLFS